MFLRLTLLTKKGTLLPIVKLPPRGFFKRVEIRSLAPLNPDPPARRRVGGQAQKFPAQKGKLAPFLKSAVTAISKMAKSTASGPLNSDPPTVPTVGDKAQQFSLANSRAHARAGLTISRNGEINGLRPLNQDPGQFYGFEKPFSLKKTTTGTKTNFK